MGSVGFHCRRRGDRALLDFVPPVGVLWACTAILAGILIFSLLLPEVGRKLTERLSPPSSVCPSAHRTAFVLACLRCR